MKKHTVLPVLPNSFHKGPGTGHGGMAAQYRTPVEKAKNVKGTLLRLRDYLETRRTGLIVALLTVLATTLLNILGPALIGFAIDRFISNGVDMSGLTRIAVVLAIVYLSVALLSFAQEWIMTGVSQSAIRRLRRDLFHKYQELSIPFFDQRNAGELMSRMTNDIENISATLSSGALELFSGILSIIAVTFVMICLNLQLALVCLSIIPLVVLVTKHIAKHTRSGYRNQLRYLGELNSIVEESISGQRVVKAFSKEEELTVIFFQKNSQLKKATRKANIYAGFMGPLMNMMNNLNYAITAFAGGVFASLGLVTVGTIAAFLTYTRQFARPLNQLAQTYNSIQSALAGAERVFELLDQPSEYSGCNETGIGSVRGDVEISGLHFGYNPEIPVIRGINIQVEAGQTIALVGPSGAGKTTIANLLTRFYEPQSGSILVDGIDIRTVCAQDLRSHIGMVLQDTFLFSTTVKENIRFGRLDAGDEEIIEAAKIANAHQFIHRMPKGYDTPVSEAGSNLSQGQKQLLAISRAVLSNPSILILDEAMSNVDTRTEMHIQDAILTLMKGRTSFVIAHRLSTIRSADLILVMDKGIIVEKGAHDALLAAKGFYHRLYHSQFAV